MDLVGMTDDQLAHELRMIKLRINGDYGKVPRDEMARFAELIDRRRAVTDEMKRRGLRA